MSDFYVGYVPQAPQRLARWVRLVILILLVAAAALAFLLASNQRGIGPGFFEYGTVRTLEGVIEERPNPVLWVDRPGAAGTVLNLSRYLLVGAGKHGAGAAVAGLDGARVRISGTLIYRDDRTMVQLEAPPVRVQGGSPPRPALQSLGSVTLTGEIVDGKCYLGVMNPGNGKVHRSCAVRCISGGSPAMLVVRDTEGRWRVMELITRDGRGLGREVFDLVAEPVTVSGELLRAGDSYLLRTGVEDILPAWEEAPEHRQPSIRERD